MPSTLYRKYRPQFFHELVNQNHIKITLTNELETERVAHAYLFAGPRGVGKTTCARLLAKALNCQKRKKGQAEPCNQCITCQEITQGRSLDLIEIDAASHTGVDNVRENIINSSRVAPTANAYKVFIIDEVHMLSLSAFNALLKTLEEPPSQVIFILATTEVHKVPETIISRCQRFDFQKIGVKEIIDRLAKIAAWEKIKVEPKVLEAIAIAAQGSVRDAESILGQVFSLGDKEIKEELLELVIPRSDFRLVVEFLSYLAQSNTASAIELVNKLVEEGINVRKFIKSVIEVLRKIILIKVSRSLDEFSPLELEGELEDEIEKIVPQIEISKLLNWIKIFLEKESLFKTDIEIIQLPLELAILEVMESSKNKEILKQEKNNPEKFTSIGTKEEKKEKKNYSPDKASIKTPVNKSIKLTDIKNKWDLFLKRLKQHNHSLALTLQVSELIALENNVLTLGFGYQFYQDLIWEKKNKEIVERVLKETFDLPLKIKAKVEKELRRKNSLPAQKTPKETNGSLKEVLDAFGGEVVE